MRSARELGIEPNELRFKSLVRPEQMPFDNIAKRHFDSGDYPEALRRAIDAIGFDTVRARQSQRRAGRPPHRHRLCHVLPSRPATAPASTPPGAFRSCRASSRRMARFTPDGGLELRIGAHSHGQGLETTLSQVAHSILGVPHERIRLVHGDTAETPYSTGTWGSRCMIMAGGAVAAACDELAEPRAQDRRRTAAGASARTCASRTAGVVGPSGRIARRRRWRAPGIAARRTCRPMSIRAAWSSPPATRPSATPAPSATRRTRPWSPSMPDTGEVEILDYVVVEDGGVLVNPMIVDGQIVRRRRAGHRHRALRGDALRRAGPAARLDAVRLPAAGPDRGAGHPHPAHGDAVALHALRPEGRRRGRRHRPAGRHHQRRQRRARRALGVELLVSPITPRRIVEAIERAAPKAAVA